MKPPLPYKSYLLPTLLLWYVSTAQSCAQKETLFLNGNFPNNLPIDIRRYAWINTDTGKVAKSIEVIRQEPFRPFSDKPVSRKYIKTVDWATFALKNTHPTDTLSLFLFCGFQHSIEAYFFQNNVQIDFIKTGHIAKIESTVSIPSIDNLSIPLKILPHQTITCYLKIINYKQTIKPSIKPEELTLFTPGQYRLLQAQQFRDRQVIILFLAFLVGLCVFLGVSSLFYFFLNKDRTYLWWALYLVSNVLYFTGRIEVFTNSRLISLVFPNYLIVSAYTVTTLTAIFYILFITSFFNIKTQSPGLYRWIRHWYLTTLGLFAVLLFISFRIDSFTDLPPLFLSLLQGIIWPPIFVILAKTFRKNLHSAYLLIVGSLFLAGFVITGSIVNATTTINLDGKDAFWKLGTLYFGMGVLLELLFFQLALAQRNQRIEKEKQQIKENEALRVQKLTGQFEQKISEIEMAALRAQMNPHFIFNCLNSIQLYTAQNNTEKASDYLTKFSRLIRLVLENSRSNKVTLDNEFETLRLYLEMETMRFRGKVNYQIDIDRNIDQAYIQIPPCWCSLLWKTPFGTG